MKLSDFHAHTLLSDGVLIPAEHIRRLIVSGLDTIAITDHVDSATIGHVVNSLDKIRHDFDDYITFLPGVEITHVLPYQIPVLVKKAKLLTKELREKTALGAGIPETMFEEMFIKNPEELVKRIIQ